MQKESDQFIIHFFKWGPQAIKPMLSSYKVTTKEVSTFTKKQPQQHSKMGNEKANCADTQIKIDADIEVDTTKSSYLSPKTSDPQCQPVWIIVIIGIAILLVLVVPPLLRAILGKYFNYRS